MELIQGNVRFQVTGDTGHWRFTLGTHLQVVRRYAYHAMLPNSELGEDREIWNPLPLLNCVIWACFKYTLHLSIPLRIMRDTAELHCTASTLQKPQGNVQSLLFQYIHFHLFVPGPLFSLGY